MLPDYLACIVLTVLYRTANDATEKVELKLTAAKAWEHGVVFFDHADGGGYDLTGWRVSADNARAYAIRTITADWAGWIIAGDKPGEDWMPELTRMFRGFTAEVHVAERRSTKASRSLLAERARVVRNDRRVVEVVERMFCAKASW